MYTDQKGNTMYIVLEYAKNGNLFKYLRSKPNFEASLPEFVRIYDQVLSAVEYMHSRNIIHRDLKPENILLDENFNAKVSDFGWAIEIQEGKERQSFCGTYEYMAPEIFEGEEYSYSVDIWALGIMLYEIIHRHSPFFGKSSFQIYKKIVKESLEFKLGIDPLAEKLIREMLATNPKARPSVHFVRNHPFILNYLKRHTESNSETTREQNLMRTKLTSEKNPTITCKDKSANDLEESISTPGTFLALTKSLEKFHKRGDNSAFFKKPQLLFNVKNSAGSAVKTQTLKPFLGKTNSVIDYANPEKKASFIKTDSANVVRKVETKRKISEKKLFLKISIPDSLNQPLSNSDIKSRTFISHDKGQAEKMLDPQPQASSKTMKLGSLVSGFSPKPSRNKVQSSVGKPSALNSSLMSESIYKLSPPKTRNGKLSRVFSQASMKKILSKSPTHRD